jgi:SAM-dependent methyltransferase
MYCAAVASRAGLSLDPAREEAELREYLGADYDHERLQQYQRTLDEEVAEIGDEERLYRVSRGYLYNLTAFAITGTKMPYLDVLTRHVEPGARILDYGCGIGSDGLMLLEAGYRVEFADFDNPSTEYLRWRLEGRGLEATIHDIDDHVPAGFDAAFAFDVIEHVPDPFEFLGEMESRARLVEVNFLEPDADEQDLHHPLPISRLVGHAARHRLVFYRVLHGGSHLVVYEGEEAGFGQRMAGQGRVAVAHLRRAVAD